MRPSTLYTADGSGRPRNHLSTKSSKRHSSKGPLGNPFPSRELPKVRSIYASQLVKRGNQEVGWAGRGARGVLERSARPGPTWPGGNAKRAIEDKNLGYGWRRNHTEGRFRLACMESAADRSDMKCQLSIKQRTSDGL